MPAQARYWLLTIPRADWEVPEVLPAGMSHLKGQEEVGAGGYHHWQLVVAFSSARRLRAVKLAFCVSAHAEPSRSAAADEYVWKEDTAVAGTRFELGSRQLRRNVSADFEKARELAKSGKLDELPADLFIRYYRTFKEIAADYCQPIGIERDVYVFWGPTAVGKSRRAWEEAGLDAYCKDPRTKWWCGYRNQKHVIIDEFGGESTFAIEHALRWFDRYPVIVETKGSSRPLLAEKIWITSNINPRDWYNNVPQEQKEALLRRLIITQFHAAL